jgi:cysteinyl-tRNA synthetase
MSLKYCGAGFDLHGGGADLIFPHHENEIAQSECATGVTFVHHWMHTAHLMVEGAKMSKSLGNLYTVADVCQRGFDPLVLRYALMSGHYRQPLNFTWETLDAAQSAVQRLARVRRLLQVEAQQVNAENGWGMFEKFWRAMNDDLNVPAALGHLFTALNGMGDPRALDEAARLQQGRAFERVLFVLGLEKLSERSQPDAREIPAEAKLLAEKRWQARLARDWKTADALRNELAALGWTMKDGRDGYELVAATE